MLEKEKKLSNKLWSIIFILVLVSVILLFTSYHNTIFQCGNPVPYLIASMSIGKENSYVEVKKNSGIYITKRGESTELFNFIKENWDVKFVEQAGSGFIFTNGVDNLTVSSEIYWSKFTVWKIPPKNQEQGI